jgi:hypothetical protein
VEGDGGGAGAWATQVEVQTHAAGSPPSAQPHRDARVVAVGAARRGEVSSSAWRRYLSCSRTLLLLVHVWPPLAAHHWRPRVGTQVKEIIGDVEVDTAAVVAQLLIPRTAHWDADRLHRRVVSPG